MKWNESGFRPPLCTYRLNWARRTSWGWRDDWDDTVLQTQDSKFEPWRSEAEHATSRSRRLPTILTFTRGWGRNIFVSFKPPNPGTEPRTLARRQRETRHYHGYCADIFSCINKNLRYFTCQHINPASVAPQYLLFYISLAQDQVISCLKILGSINLFIEIIGLLRPAPSRLNGHTS